jgi:hypothetical protein
MATSILQWYRLGKAKTTNETQTKKLSKTQRKNRKLKQTVNKATSLKTLAYATASAIKRDGLRTTSYFDNAIKTVFNNGDVIFAEKALEEGFISDIISFNELTNKLVAKAVPTSVNSNKPANNIKKEKSMEISKEDILASAEYLELQAEADYITLIESEFNNDFAQWKNFLNSNCKSLLKFYKIE